MLKGIFGTWLKEFSTLVLTQTVQAFLLAIVMIIIISCLGSSNSTGEAESNQAAGLLAIVALASFGKIEMLVKQIFGVTSQFGDPSLQAGAKGLTAGGMLAMHGAKRLTDNASKSIEGRRKIKEAKKGLAALNADSSGTDGAGGDLEKKGDKEEVKTDPGGSGQNVMKLEGTKSISDLNAAINRLASNVESAGGGSKREKYEQMLKEGKDLKRSAARENVGAAIGGMTGAMVGLARGEDIAQTTLAGAGAGDALGQASADAKAKKIDYKNRMGKLNAELDKLTQEQYNQAMENAEESFKAAGVHAPGSIARKAGRAYQSISDNGGVGHGGVTKTVQNTVKNSTVGKTVTSVRQDGVKETVKNSSAGKKVTRAAQYQKHSLDQGRKEVNSSLNNEKK